MLKWYVLARMLNALSVGGLVFVWLGVALFLLAYFDRNRSKTHSVFGDFQTFVIF